MRAPERPSLPFALLFALRSHLGRRRALFAWTVGYLTIFSPGGLGLRELLVTEALGPVVGREVAAVAALLWRLANLLTEALGALLFEFLWRRSGGTP